MSFAIQLTTSRIPTPTGETWVWIFQNLQDWQGKALPVLATKFVTPDLAQAKIDKFNLSQYGAQVVDLVGLARHQVAGQVPQEVAPKQPTFPAMIPDPKYQPYTVPPQYPQPPSSNVPPPGPGAGVGSPIGLLLSLTQA